MAYPELSGREYVSHVGGAERQQVLLSEELLRRGYRISFVVLDHGQPDGEEIRGIRVLKSYRADVGMRGFRFFHPRLSGLWSALRRADADVYYQRGADTETGLVGQWCRWHRRGLIFSFAHDLTCTLLSPFPARPPDRWLFRYGLRRADVVLTQTPRQQRILRDTFNLASTVIPNCCGWLPEVEQVQTLRDYDATRDRVLWVGRLSEEKRPEWVVRLATDLPECRFDIAGQSNRDSQYGRTLEERIRLLPNVRWHGYVAHTEMRRLYRQCRVLLCTSESEGFPNVFLEAWSCAKPVLTTVDPDDVVNRFQLGQVAPDYLMLKQYLSALSVERPMWEASGRRGARYVQEHHGTAAVADVFEGVIQTCHQALTARQFPPAALLHF